MKGALALLLTCAGCAAPSPFPDLGPDGWRDWQQILRERTTTDRALTAELVIDYRGTEPDGEVVDATFDAVARFSPDGSMEISAFKDLVFSVQPIFDLSVDSETFRIENFPEDGPSEVESGPASELPNRFPRFRSFAWARDAFVLPGGLMPGAQVSKATATTLCVLGALPHGGRSVFWTMRTDTLEVESGLVIQVPKYVDPEPSIGFEYSRYRRAGNLFVPGRVIVTDADLTLDIHVSHVELDPLPATPESP